MPVRRLTWLLTLLLCVAPCLAAEGVLRYPRAPVGDEFRSAYPLAQLQLALDKVGSSLRIVPSQHHMEQQRALLSLEQGEAVDVVWTMTSLERERHLLPVRIPLDKGLYGWRIALLRADQPNLLQGVHNLSDLGRLRAGQGHDWPDTAILRGQGLRVEVSSSYESLFLMLEARRFDYFPRAVLEVEDELRHNRQRPLVADRYLVLHYPTALYFFFSPNDPQLAEIVRQGLELALADGSFERVFQQYHGADLRRVALEQRQIIELDNPLLPPQTPLQRRELWYRP
ncbi:transporter substrate-binding domain-containing protein [Pseudomonas sp. PDM15]|uniref:substrate-binding periplasmic protein n=1 Tax=Pseudomonas sp. PDM15 TaxID=2769303 RepID=UPI00177DBC9F|nr:transporter substrate-binding domain-containing protein [Pseudomonas sp. PDM15]MBD9424831.1 transporter substrate-binding domain-containing protein [Pseudomonas sp. PDM15]